MLHDSCQHDGCLSKSDGLYRRFWQLCHAVTTGMVELCAIEGTAKMCQRVVASAVR